ncbi:MAG: hypothetical protein IIC60_11425 [Proteobacteria bacterium]|nr:hypothetical protein [Pseudomonadota bacterium]
MNKLAQAVVEESLHETIQETRLDSDQLYLKKKKEDQIRMKLDQFAKELSRVEQQRDKH